MSHGHSPAPHQHPASPAPHGLTEAAARDLLRHAKMRITPVRLAIMQLLSRSTATPDAAEVAAALESRKLADVDRVTVYRTLNALVDAGLAHRIDPGDRIYRFGLTDHAHCSGEHHAHEHPHMICDSCGAVECIEDAEVIIQPRPASSPSSPATSRRKFRISQQSIMLHGTCDMCEEKHKPETGAKGNQPRGNRGMRGGH